MAHTLEITTCLPCINNCKFCPQDLLRSKYDGEFMMTFSQFAEILSKVPKNVRIDFAGFSEPFMNRRSAMMMRHAYDNGYKVSLYTTLVGCTDIDIALISGIKFDPCVIHIPDNVNFVVENEDEWVETYKRVASKIEITENHFHIGRPSEKVKSVVGSSFAPLVQPRAGTVDPSICSLPYKSGPLKCSAVPTGVVLPNGDVVLCCMDYGLKHKLGNLLVDSYEDLYESEEYKKVLRAMTDESIESICRYCYVPHITQ